MDNLMGKVLMFLIKPESILSVVFLMIFILCLIWGVYKAKQCLDMVKDFSENAEAEYSKMKDRYTPDFFIHSFEERLSGEEFKIESLPNVFVSVGILGTFIGLGIAIQGATSLLSTDKVDLAQLNAVLSVIAFKFQTSVWGTCFSLIYQKFCYEAYVGKKQIILFEAKVKLYEKETSIRTTLENQLDTINDMQVHFSKYVDCSVDFVNATQSFRQCVGEMHVDLGSYNDRLVETLENNNRNLVEAQNRINEVNNKTIDGVMQTLEHIHNAIADSQQKIGEMHEGLWFRMEASLERMQKQFVRSENLYVKDTQESFNKILLTSLDRVHKEYLDGAKNLDGAVRKLEGVLEGIDKRVSAIHNEFIEEHVKLSKVNNDIFDSINKAMDHVTEVENQHMGNMLTIYSKMENILQNVESSNLDGVGKIESLVSGFKVVAADGFNALSKKQDADGKLLEKIIQDNKDARKEHFQQVQDLAAELIKQYQASSKELVEVQRRIEGLNKELLSKSAEELQRSMKVDAENTVQQSMLLERIEGLNKELLSMSAGEQKRSAEYISVMKENAENSSQQNKLLESLHHEITSKAADEKERFAKLVSVMKAVNADNSAQIELMQKMLETSGADRGELHKAMLQILDSQENTYRLMREALENGCFVKRISDSNEPGGNKSVQDAE